MQLQNNKKMIKSKHTSKKGLSMKLQKDHGKSQTNSGKAKDTKTKGPDTPEEYTITFPELKTVEKKQLSCYTQGTKFLVFEFI